MLLGGKGGCQQCRCVPCDECTRTCQNPHTGDAFEVVYTRYFEGAEDGNVSDGYLTASGDSDTSDPYDGMDGNGPWFQQITGGFTLNSTQTRHPCRVTVSFWRNNYTLGAATIPPASTALTFQGVFVEVSSGAVVIGENVITPEDGEVEIETASIPLVSGGGDQSENDPRFYEGSISVAPQCESASFSIRARIEWNTQKRQHVLYGIVRECYEEGTPCDNFCSDSLSVPDSIYLTMSSLTLTNSTGWAGGPFAMASFNSALAAIDGVPIVLERTPNLCALWTATLRGSTPASWSGSLCYLYIQYNSYSGLLYLYAPVNYLGDPPNVVPLGGCNEALIIYFTATVACISGTSFYEDGTATASANASVTSGFGSYGGIVMDASTDWVVES